MFTNASAVSLLVAALVCGTSAVLLLLRGSWQGRPSLISKLMPLAITLRGSKKRHSSAEATLAAIAALRLRPESYAPPTKLDRTVILSVRSVGGWPVYEVAPREAPDTERRGLYIHGGAWVYEIQPRAWEVVAALAVASNTRFTVPIYPLAPEGVAADVVPRLTDIAAELGPERTTLLGDSAGGGMALAVALQLLARGLSAARHLIMISPALDLSFTSAEMDKIAPLDPWLAKPGLSTAAQLYRGELPIEDAMVSPLNGNLAGLGPVTLFCGTRDILVVDARRFVQLAKAAGVHVDYYEGPEMIHVYPILPFMPEARQALGVIARILSY